MEIPLFKGGHFAWKLACVFSSIVTSTFALVKCYEKPDIPILLPLQVQKNVHLRFFTCTRIKRGIAKVLVECNHPLEKSVYATA
jgi:hypothetical protein